MRGDDQQLQTGMFSYVALEDRIPADHPLRGVRKLVDAVLAGMSKDFDGLYSEVGRPSIAPERLLRALLLQVFYSVRSERLLMEQLNYNLLFRWFVGLGDRRRGMEPRGVQQEPRPAVEPGSGAEVLRPCERAGGGADVGRALHGGWDADRGLGGTEELSPQGRRRSGSGGDFHGEPRRNQTHASRTDPEARLYKKSAGQEAKLSYLGHTLVENRNGLIAAAMTTQADGRAERDAALLMLHELTRKRSGRITTGADKAYDTRDFVNTVRELGVTPHVARRQHGAIDERTSRHPGYAISLSKRWLVEKPFGWLKQIGPLKKVKLRGLAKVDWLFVFSCAAFNLIRIPKLRAQSA